MYFLYVDESGDPGMTGSPTRYFVLSGIVLHELRWRNYLDQLVDFRQRMRRAFGLRMNEEIHSAALINKPGGLVRIKRNDRLTILRSFASELASMAHLSAINIVVDKQRKQPDYDAFTMAWKALFQRFENTMSHQNFPGPKYPDEIGMVFADTTDTKKLTQLLRQMRRYNPVAHQPQFGIGYRDLALKYICEDPNFRDSQHSYYIQAADLVAFLLYQKICPSSYMRRKSGHNYFNTLDPILCKVASRGDRQGIVWL